MNWRKKPVYFVVLGLLTILLAPWAAARASERSAAPGSHFVRISAGNAAAAGRLGLSPRLDIDYGSFRWLEVSDADLAKLAASNLDYTLVPDAGTLQVTRYRFDPLADGEPALPAGMTADTAGAGFRFIQLVGPTQDSWLTQLEGSGLRLLQYYPHHTYLVWGTADQAEAVANFDFVRWTGAFHPGYKINTDLDDRTGTVNNVDIFFYNDGNVKATLEAITAAGGTILNHFPAQPDKAFYDAIVQVNANNFARLAQINTVLWFGFSSPAPVLDDEMSDQIVAGNYTAGVPFIGYEAHLSALGVDGTGVRWAIIDTGVDYQHPDLDPNIAGGYSFPGACNPAGEPGSDCPGQGHGSHVAGIVGGTGDGVFDDPQNFLYGVGVAPAAEFFAMNSLSGAAWPPAGGWQEHSKQAVLGGAIGGNNSWTTGEGPAHGYQASERTHDIMVRDGNFDTAAVAEPFIEVFSAGNSGPGASTLTAPHEAKNIIATASSLNFRAGNIDTISSFSSRGPAVDGRIGVTIAAPGEDIISANNDTGTVCGPVVAGTNNLYVYCSGTSMAAPHAAGSLALITDWWRGFNEGGADPSPAMAKALLINGAVDMGTANIPNTNEGWGRVNFTNVISPSALVLYYDQEDLLDATGDQIVLSVGVPDPSEPLKITLVWADAPGAVGANPALVNNLNLTVDNGGDIYRGNVFSSGWSTTGGSADLLNNMENVYVQSPNGNAVITIDAANISGDGVPYNGDTTDQDFALVCYNCSLGPDFTLSATPNTLDVCAPADAVYQINVGSVLGYNDNVTLSAVNNPAGTTTNFSTNPVTPPGSSNLTIGNTGAATAGSYSIDVVGVAPTSTHTTTVGLNLFEDAPAAPTLTSPANGATSVSTQPTFSWNAVAQAASYDIEIATDAGFTNIVDSATVAGTAYTPGVGLNPNTVYYWRVRANNPCGPGTFSTTFSFTTSLCATPGLAIPDNDPVGVTTDMNLAGDAIIDDLDVSLVVPHTWVGDLRFVLTHVDTGTSVTFIDRPGVPASVNGCSNNDIDAMLDDEATDPVENECAASAPTINGTFTPNNPLSAFDGEEVGGTWRLTAADHVGQDVGVVEEWCILTESTPIPAAGISASDDDTGSGLVGSDVTYTVAVTNTGNVTDTFALTIAGNSWTTVADASSVGPLAPGASGTVTVTVTVGAGVSDTATITFTSGFDNSVTAAVTLTTTAKAEEDFTLYLPVLIYNE